MSHQNSRGELPREPHTLTHQLLKISQALSGLCASAAYLGQHPARGPEQVTEVREAIVGFFFLVTKAAYTLEPSASISGPSPTPQERLNDIVSSIRRARPHYEQLPAHLQEAVQCYSALVEAVMVASTWSLSEEALYALFSSACRLLWHNLPGDEHLWDSELDARLSLLLDKHLVTPSEDAAQA